MAMIRPVLPVTCTAASVLLRGRAPVVVGGLASTAASVRGGATRATYRAGGGPAPPTVGGSGRQRANLGLALPSPVSGARCISWIVAWRFSLSALSADYGVGWFCPRVSVIGGVGV